MAVSRSTSRGGLRILIENTDGSCGSKTRNVVYREVLAASALNFCDGLDFGPCCIYVLLKMLAGHLHLLFCIECIGSHDVCDVFYTKVSLFRS